MIPKSGEAVFLIEELPPPGPFQLDGDEGRHAATVKRTRRGERLILTDGRGGWAPAVVSSIGRGTLSLEVAAAHDDPVPELRVVVVQALAKGERSDLAVDLATEAGADEIVPWQAERCVARWTATPTKADRGRSKWQAAARAASKQSRRSRVPVVHALADTAQVVERVRSSAAALVLHEAGSVSLQSVPLPAVGDLLLIVGPEGGISPDELRTFSAAGAWTVRLGPEVLRCSTAAAVALGALGALTDRWVP